MKINEAEKIGVREQRSKELRKHEDKLSKNKFVKEQNVESTAMMWRISIKKGNNWNGQSTNFQINELDRSSKQEIYQWILSKADANEVFNLNITWKQYEC